jgi:dihydrofolate reductase
MISLIWAQDENGLIGKGNSLPWRLPADMAWFKKNTMGKPILMGRKTFESIGKPLSGRTNLILTRQAGFAAEGCTVVHSLDEAKAAAGDTDEIMVMGGAQVYALALPEAGRLYCTRIHAVFEGDAWFPPFDEDAWKQVFGGEHGPDERNAFAYTFRIMERKA